MDLQIDFDETINVGTQVIAKSEEFETLLNEIKTVNASLQSYWEGSDASKYSTAVATQAEEVTKLISTINEIGNFLVNVGNAYEEAMNSNVGGING